MNQEADPMEYLSRHPLPITGTDSINKIVKNVLTAEKTLVLDRVRTKDKQQVTTEAIQENSQRRLADA